MLLEWAALAPVLGAAAAGFRVGETAGVSGCPQRPIGCWWGRDDRPGAAGSTLAQVETLGTRYSDGVAADEHRGRFALADRSSAKALVDIDHHSRMAC